jgi:TPR repeat protein
MLQDFNSPEMPMAMEEIDNQNYSTAFELLPPLEAASNPKAELHPATLYHPALGVAPDGERAVELYLKVGELRIEEERLSCLAYHNLSGRYICGCPRVPRDLDRAGSTLKSQRTWGSICQRRRRGRG